MRSMVVSFQLPLGPSRGQCLLASLRPAHLDDVKWLKDPDLCYQEISKEVYASVPQSMGSTVPDPLTDRNIVTNVIGTR